MKCLPFGVALALLLATGLDPAGAAPDPNRNAKFKVVEAEPDPGTLNAYHGKTGQTFYFEVTGSTTGTIWGTGVYTEDSALAVAAVHAGVLRDGKKGFVKVTILKGLVTYPGSTKNGVTSQAWGNWTASYRVEAVGARVRPVLRVGKALADPGQLSGYRAKVGQSFLFKVTGTTTGAVWGTGVYTDDSTLAAAAVHAGVLRDGQTGVVKVTILQGQAAYNGSTQNGVTSGQWANFDGSFRVEVVNNKNKKKK
jgi:LCCL domain